MSIINYLSFCKVEHTKLRDKKKLLLTGADGFVGQQLRYELLKEYDVYSYDIQTFNNDVRDKFKLDRLFECWNFDVVVNLAARAGVRRGEKFIEEYFSTNVFGLKNLIDLSEQYSVKRFIHFSSSSVFGNEDPDPVSELTSKRPKSIYGITKLAGELMLENSKLNYTIIRPFTIIGEDGRADMVIYKWINQYRVGKKITFYGDGSSFRGYTYIDDIIDGVMRCLNNKNAEREDFNIGGDSIVSLEELWKIFKEISPKAQREMLWMPDCDQMYSLADTTKAREYLGWKPIKDIKVKIKEIICQGLGRI